MSSYDFANQLHYLIFKGIRKIPVSMLLNTITLLLIIVTCINDTCTHVLHSIFKVINFLRWDYLWDNLP